MKTYYITAQFTSHKGNFWHDNVKQFFQTDKDPISAIAEVLESNYFTVSRKGKPVTNVYRDTATGEAKPVGYIFKVSTEIENKKAYFEAWTEVKEVIDIPVKEI